MATPGQQQTGVSAGNQPTTNGAPAMAGTTCVSLCRLGQETVQDIIAKTSEVFTTMKMMHLPNGVLQINPQNQLRLQDLIQHIQKQFKKLRVLYDRINQLSGGMDQSNAEELIPWKDGQDSLTDLAGLGSEDKVSAAQMEKQELMEKVRSKNQQLGRVIERLRALIWDLNTMMAMRHTTWS